MEFILRGLLDVMSAARTESGERMGENRAPGLHLSSIVKEMRRAAKLPEGIEGEQDGVRMQLGFCFEHALMLCANNPGMSFTVALEHSYRRWMVQVWDGVVTQVTGEQDGIHMTPDGLDCNEGILHSYKLTWRSKRKAISKDEFEEHFWPWLVAEKGYAWHWGVDTVRFFIGWVNGDYSYKKGGGPSIEVYDCVFTEEELRENWAAVLRYKAAMGEGD